jgi:FtsZ-binding cell division protein ZapB
MSEKLDAAFGADAADYIRQLQGEIERLRQRCDEWKTLNSLRVDEIERLRADNQRLKNKLRRIHELNMQNLADLGMITKEN